MRALALAFTLLLSAGTGSVFAETTPKSTNPATGSALVNVNAKPVWAELSPAQRNILAPLQKEWPSLESANKQKWLKIAQKYPAMKPQDQQRAQQRMHEWVRLTPDQHRVARDSYARAQKLTPEKRAELLKAYQALPEEKKQELARSNQSAKKLVIHRPTQQAVPTHAQIGQGLVQKDQEPVTVSK